jgi:hypothetical protein
LFRDRVIERCWASAGGAAAGGWRGGWH